MKHFHKTKSSYTRQCQPGTSLPAPQDTLLTGAQILFLPLFPSPPFQQRLPLTSTYPLPVSCYFRNIYSTSKYSEPPTVPSSPIPPLDVTGTVSQGYGSMWIYFCLMTVVSLGVLQLYFNNFIHWNRALIWFQTQCSILCLLNIIKAQIYWRW